MKAQKIPRVVRLYAAAARWVLPRDFCREYGGPLTEAFSDLHAAVADRGIRRWGPVVREFILLGVTGVRSRMGTGRGSRIAAVDSPQRTSNEVLGNMARDIRHGLRALARQPSYTLSAIATLALGIGANTAIFSVVHAVLQEPPPYPEPDRIVYVFETHPRFFRGWGLASPAGFRDWAGETEVFESIAAMQAVSLHLDGPAGPEQMFGRMVSPSFFRAVGVAPFLGRLLVEGDDKPGNDVAVVGHEIWRRHLGGDSSAVGASLIMNGKPYTVVGVMPEGFSFFRDTKEVWIPLTMDAETWSRRTSHFLQVLGRLRPGVTLEEGQERMDALAARIAAENPRSHAERGIALVRLHDYEVFRVAANLWMLFGAVGFVLLIACTNVANLSLSRAVARSREMSVRAALGAGGGRIVRQLLVESGLLGLLGGSAGVATAHIAVREFVLLTPSWFPRTEAVSIDGTVLLYTLLVSLATGLAFGIVPALKLARLDIAASLGSPRSGPSRRGLRLARGMVVTQVALALLLFVGAGLLVRSFQRLVAQPTGLAVEGILSAEVRLPRHIYSDEAQHAEFFAMLLERVQGLPGVMSAAVTNNLPFSYYWYGSDLVLEPEPGAEEIEARSATHRVSAGYFESLGLPVLSGRPLEPGDDARAPRVAVVNEEYVRAHLAGKDPLAARLRRANNQEWFDIVGVVGSAKHLTLDDELEPAVYFSMRQQPAAFMWVLLKAAGDPLALASALREEVRRLDRSVPVTEIATMETLISRTLAEPRFYAVLLSAFAVTAVALACIGVYGLLSYLVAQRTHEIGIRMALGARPEQVRALVVGRGLALTVPGVALGLLAAYGLTRVLRSLLYQITPGDPLTFGTVTVVFLGLAVLASYGPARRGTSVPPAEALRAD